MSSGIVSQSKWHPYLLLAGVVLLSRLPFIFDGHGHEEDSYGLVVNAWEMHSTGHYVASRFPGHPFQEYLYLLIWNQPAWIWNLFSTIFSIVAVLAFHRALKKIGMNQAIEASLILAFTPIFFNSGTYTIDYAWSLAFVLLSFSSLVESKFWWSGIFLGIAVGCRITSGIFIVPWALLIFQRMDMKTWINWTLKICIPFGVISVLFFVPAFMQYGTSFFDYSDQFPYPPMTKIIYKGTIGVFGILGLLGIFIAKCRWLFSKEKNVINAPSIVTPRRLLWFVLIICILHVISYLRLPQKAGYMLPIVPFVIMMVMMYTPIRTMRIVTILFLLSPFLLGMNITDELRGSGSSALSVKFNVSGQEISFDAIRGPALAEQQKRRNKIEYVSRVCDFLDTSSHRQILICGWWYNQILVERASRSGFYTEDQNLFTSYGSIGQSSLVFYEACDLLEDKKTSVTDPEEVTIYYLPEQDLYNDQMFNQSCTNAIAQPIPVK